MAKNIRRMFAMVLVMCMFVSALPMQALAAEGDGVVTEGPTPDANGNMVTTTTTTSTDSATGHTTVTVDIHKDVSSSDSSTGTVVTGTKDSSSTTIQYKDGEGNVVREDKVAESSSSYIVTETTNESGSSSHYVAEGKDWSKESMDIPKDGVTVDVPLTEDDPSTEAKENVNSETFGDPTGTQKVVDGEKPSAGDTNYEYTQTEVTEQGKVTVSTGNVNVTETYDKETLDKNDLEYVRSETVANGDITKLDGTNDLVYASGHAPEEYLPGYEGAVPPEGIEGYDYVYVGSGATSMLVPAIVYDRAMTDEEKVELFGDQAYIHKDLPKAYINHYLKNLSPEVRNSVIVNSDGSYKTDEEGYLVNASGERIIKGELTATGIDANGNTVTTYLHRFDAVGTSYKVEGWYEGGWQKELNGKDGYTAIWAGPQQFTLVDKDGKVITAYCADSTTPTEMSFGYNIENLEDASYYSTEEAEKIRSITLNGYWGTVGNETDADGNEILDENGQPIPKPGSLEAMKASLLESGKFTEEELKSLTDGVALTATQMAIWSNSNKMSGIKFINAHYSEWGIPDYKTQFYKDSEGNYTIPNPNYNPELAKLPGNNIPTEKEDEVDLMFRIYDYLMALAPTPAAKENADTANTVINAENFLESMDITVIKKDEDHSNNSDAYDDNDAYVTTLSFSLAVVPARDIDGNLNENDDLVVILRDKEGKVMATGRIAGEMKDDEIDMRGVTDNNYSFENITMVEGDQKFTLNLSGIQHLKEGVYLYSSEVRTVEGEDVSSQTLVGLAGGDRGVNVSVDIEFNLKVDGVVATEHVYRYEGDPNTPPHTPPTPRTPGEEVPPPQVFRLANQNVEEIPEEPVPLAAPVITGDNSGMWIAVILLSVFAMAAINLFDKKRQQETF